MKSNRKLNSSRQHSFHWTKTECYCVIAVTQLVKYSTRSVLVEYSLINAVLRLVMSTLHKAGQ